MKILVLLLLVTISQLAFSEEEGLFEQKEAKVAKWSNVYVSAGRAAGTYSGAPDSFNESTVGYLQIRGKFGYGVQVVNLGDGNNNLRLLQAVASVRPDWDLAAEPSLELSFGTLDLTGPGQNNGNGTSTSIGVRVDIFKSKTFSTGAVMKEYFFNTNAPGVGNSTLQSVGLVFSINMF